MAGNNTTQHPPQPIVDRGIRFESSTVTPSELPPLKPQARQITDRGIVRFGSGTITSER